MARTKKIESTPVRIRFKELENGNKSIYLDIYYEKKRRYEFLKLYLIPENSSEARKQNKHTMKASHWIYFIDKIPVFKFINNLIIQ